MKENQKILLFAHPRSGSTTLMHILNLHPSIDLLLEPFNEQRTEWDIDNKDYRSYVSTPSELDRVLEEILDTYDGFKHLSYQLPEHLTEHLLARTEFRVIFLYRKNFLKAAVSALIAEQTSIWHLEDGKKTKKEISSLKSLDIEMVRRKIQHFKDDIYKYRTMAQEKGVSMFEVSHEELFSGSEEMRVDKIKEIFAFLGQEFPSDQEEGVKKLLSPARKVTGKNTYELVPNIQEVEQMCGSVENGFLFK